MSRPLGARNKVPIIPDCHEAERHYARGLCKPCYMAQRHRFFGVVPDAPITPSVDWHEPTYLRARQSEARRMTVRVPTSPGARTDALYAHCPTWMGERVG